ncbi:MAG TPA: hypothetical protein VFK05_16305 [Polyangiaceae bacterium]|nr:hypothetical protein [Polyangiaceae bacterium]
MGAFAAFGALTASLLGAGCASAGGENIWDSSSQRIEVQCGSFFEGATAFRADRSELTSEQLSLLDRVETVDGNDRCVEDARSCHVTVTARNGAKRDYLATQDDATCGSARDYIRYASFEPFIESLHCQYSKQEDQSPVAADPLCLQGMFSPSGGTTVHRLLHVEERSRSYHVELDHCIEPNRLSQISMELEVDGELIAGAAPASPGEDEACLALDFTPNTAGEFDLVVTTTSSFLPAGDYYLQFR